MDKNYKIPAVVWLKMTDYMHGWLQYELGCALRVKDQKVVCVQHLPGARDILMRETVNDRSSGQRNKTGLSMSARRRNYILAGISVDREMIEREYGLTEAQFKLFVPVECPKMCTTEEGLLRPWSLDTNLSKRQASDLQNLLRQAFWDAVAAFDKAYAAKMDGKRYPAVDMIEAFCVETDTPDLYVAAMRREWQRRVKRAGSRP